ncbi:MAG: Do family serine endopeptidase [Caulobacteraceae bacterium]|nr:Do family serine endopeptidase [Caulobacteraceae bacterium]
MPVKKTAFFVGAVAGASVAVAAIAGAGLKLPAPAGGPHGGSLIQASTAPIFAPAPGAPQSFADIFERVSPAVVSIHVTSKVDVSALRQAIPGFGDLPFDIVPKGNGSGGPDERPAPKQQSSGSGFFISPEGYVVTNNHVIQGADEIKVVTKDGAELKAAVVGRDEATDLAVLKVEGHNYPFVSFETSVKPRVGDWVVAVGNPFDLGGTATAGIVSAYNRDIGESAFDNYIQIDAPINRGNSGGPTFDVYGRVIGVNAAIYSPTGGSVGIGFAIPADVADEVTKQLMEGRKITRGYIGATIENLSPELADAWGLSGRRGAQVADLVPGGPAEKAGLMPGDVVVAVNGVAVKTNAEMTREVAKAHAGDVIRLDVFRVGKARTVDIRSGVRPSEDQLALNGRGQPNSDEDQGGADHPAATPGAPVLGMQLAPLNAMTRGQFNIPDSVKAGVVVQGVKGTSDAAEKGLQRGDVIVRAGDRQVASASDVAGAVADWKKSGRGSIPLAVRRGGQVPIFIPLKIDG